MLIDAFNQTLNIQAQTMDFYDNETKVTTPIKAAPSNYFRNLSAPEEMVIKGKEFVVSKRELDSKSIGKPQRGNILIDTNLGSNPIVEVREMMIMGEVAGYRLRTH